MILHTAHDENRDRLLIIATWLISLGAVFLIKDAFGWSWQQAWPLWIIFVGVGSAGSALFSAFRSPLGMWGMWWPIAVVAVGIVLLLSTTGNLGYSPAQLVAWWPLAVIALGVWFLFGALIARPSSGSESLNVPLGTLTEAQIKVNFGGGELVVGPAESGSLISGQFAGGAVARDRGNGRFEIEPFTGSWPLWWTRPIMWRLGLTDAIPVDLRLDTGANRSQIDLSALMVRRLELHTGMSETRVCLPGSGSTYVRAEAGLASLEIEVPPGVSARIHSKVGLGSTNVDETRFPRTADGWASPDYESATNRAELELSGGLGTIKVA
jgi:hypothetical protein